jgi:hypothetical protein
MPNDFNNHDQAESHYEDGQYTVINLQGRVFSGQRSTPIEPFFAGGESAE